MRTQPINKEVLSKKIAVERTKLMLERWTSGLSGHKEVKIQI